MLCGVLSLFKFCPYKPVTSCQALTDQGVKSLICQICKNLHGLQTLVLNFSKLSQYSKKITDDPLINLAREIQGLKNLETLVLNFNEILTLTINGLKFLVRKINEHLELETLILSFEGCNRISVEEKYSLRQTITKISNVQIL